MAAGADLTFFRRTGAGLILFFLAAIGGAKVKPLASGGKQI
jgi:hypothetical protein